LHCSPLACAVIEYVLNWIIEVMYAEHPSSQAQSFSSEVSEIGLIRDWQGHFHSRSVADNGGAVTVVAESLGRVINAVINISNGDRRQLTTLQSPAIGIFAVPRECGNLIRLGRKALANRLTSHTDRYIDALRRARYRRAVKGNVDGAAGNPARMLVAA